MREKLIELIEQARYCSAEELADYLIAAGLELPKRCKDCGAYNRTGCADGFGWCGLHNKGMMDYDFCSLSGVPVPADEIDFDYNAEDV